MLSDSALHKLRLIFVLFWFILRCMYSQSCWRTGCGKCLDLGPMHRRAPRPGPKN